MRDFPISKVANPQRLARGDLQLEIHGAAARLGSIRLGDRREARRVINHLLVQVHSAGGLRDACKLRCGAGGYFAFVRILRPELFHPCLQGASRHEMECRSRASRIDCAPLRPSGGQPPPPEAGSLVCARPLARFLVFKKMMPLPCKPDSVRPLRDWTAISLTPPERSAPLTRGATITRGLWRAGSPAPVLSCTARGLPCRRRCLRRGGLLPHHFTLARTLAGRWRYDFCGTFRPVPSRSPSPTFMGRAALWCPDFPQAPLARHQRPSGERLARLPRHGGNSKENIHRKLVLESGADEKPTSSLDQACAEDPAQSRADAS